MAAVQVEEVGDFIRPAWPAIAVQDIFFPPSGALGRWRGYGAISRIPVCQHVTTVKEEAMTSITGVAEQFFGACETGKGWDGCKPYCTPDATFSAQAEPLADVKTLQQYTDWMKGLLTLMPDGRYELKSFGTDAERKSVAAYGVFSGTHTGQGGPVPPTGKTVNTDYVYVMEFEADKIRHMTKIWHAGLAMKDLGWV